jgi:hypothetical protein
MNTFTNESILDQVATTGVFVISALMVIAQIAMSVI